MNIGRIGIVAMLAFGFGFIMNWPRPVSAGQFYITEIESHYGFDYGDKQMVGSGSKAQYEGEVDLNDRQWNIGASVRPAFGTWHHGTPNSGMGMVTGKLIECTYDACGGNAQVNKCTASGTNNAFTYKGEVAILHPGNNDDDNMSRIGRMICNANPSPGTPAPRDPEEGTEDDPAHTPILIDVERDHYQLTGLSDAVAFDIDGDGDEDILGWTDATSDDAFLALDRNGNGFIDSGRELFGSITEQPPSQTPNGFAALAVLDRAEYGGDEDGAITAADSAFYQLLLWTDQNHDGYSQGSEIEPLSTSSIEAIELAYVENGQADQHGNWFRWKSKVHFEQGTRFAAVDVILVAEE